MTSVRPERVRKLNSLEQGDGPVIYWMNRDCRIHDNWAYAYAAELARVKKVPLLVLYNLAPGFLGGGYRQHAFKVKGLEEVAAYCEKFGTPFFLVEGTETEKDIVAFAEKHKAGAILTDFFPLRISRAWSEYVRKHVECAFFGVDAHNIIPCWITSDKQEFAARTIRPKIHRLLPEYIEEFPILKQHPYAYEGIIPEINWQSVLEHPAVDQSVKEVDWITPGHKEGMRAIERFITERLPTYADARNDATISGQSDLSPYLHYGQIAPARVVLELLQAHPNVRIQMLLHEQKNGSGSDATGLTAIIEELVVRRELSDNFCFYNPHYDSVEGFPEWAQKSLAQHAHDERETLYTREQFENAETHDELWNAAQKEMVARGKMHGYLRMYWAKKILEWSKAPADALKTTIYLNDKYELDGRDPNGYVGAAWSIGGLHDRPWFNRPIFGQIRYMARSGCEKKFDVDAYIKQWS